MGYSKVPEQLQSSARPICHSHNMANTGREPATMHTAAYRSSPRYALRHGRQFGDELLYMANITVNQLVNNTGSFNLPLIGQ